MSEKRGRRPSATASTQSRQATDVPLVRHAGGLQGPRWPGLLRSPGLLPRSSLHSCLSWCLGFCPSPGDSNTPLPRPARWHLCAPTRPVWSPTLPVYLCLDCLHSFTRRTEAWPLTLYGVSPPERPPKPALAPSCLLQRLWVSPGLCPATPHVPFRWSKLLTGSKTGCRPSR